MPGRPMDPLPAARPVHDLLGEIDDLAQKAARKPVSLLGRHLKCRESQQLSQLIAHAVQGNRYSQSRTLAPPSALLPPLA